MNVNEINAYLERAHEIIGDRSKGEIDYDNAVVAHLRACFKNAFHDALARRLSITRIMQMRTIASL